MTIWPASHPFAPQLNAGKPFLLDGGLGIELQKRGYDLQHPLWSARLLAEAPEVIREVHIDFLRAGADCLITSSYQAAVPGLLQTGYSRQEAQRLFMLSVQVAREARDACNRPEVLIAASIGPYGAYLADDSEFRGDYHVPTSEMKAFHRERWELLARHPDVDLLACETIPSFPETKVLLELLEESPDTWAWFTFTCRGTDAIADGTPISEVVAAMKHHPQVAGIGVNCVPPQKATALISAFREAGATQPLMVYPNSGKVNAPGTLSKFEDMNKVIWADLVWAAKEAGANVMGGCCGTGPAHIRQLSSRIY